MAYCIWCEKKGLFLRIDKKGLCKDCQSVIESKINKNIKNIRKSISLIEKADNSSYKVKECINILESAKVLLKFEEKKILKFEPLPSSLIKEYTTLHDRLILQSKPDNVDRALTIAENSLKPFNEIHGVKAALKKITDVKAILTDYLTPKIIALINQKGGVGKTTSTINLGAALAKLNKKVLLIDFDPQSNLTDGLGNEEKNIKFSIYDILKGDAVCEDVILKSSEHLSIVPSNIFLAKAEKEFSKNSRNVYLLRNVLKEIRGVDFILIDCPPSLGILTLNALAAAHEVIIPLQPEYFALRGIRKLLDVVDFIKEKVNNPLVVMGIIGTRYDSRKILHREVLNKIRESMGNEIFYTVIRENIALAEASSYGQTIFEYKPKSHGAEDYINLGKEVLERSNNKKLMQNKLSAP